MRNYKNSSLAIFTLSVSGLVAQNEISIAAHIKTNAEKPNILYIMSDDHSFQTIGVYATLLKEHVNTPNIDRIAQEGVRMNACYVNNSISTPSRGAMLTGQYSHHNGVYTLMDALDPELPNMAKELQSEGYNTSVIGKWHLKKQPSGFDYYLILDGQGEYNNPTFFEMGRPFNKQNKVTIEGYSSDVITDQSIAWLDKQTDSKPFFLMCHYKAPHTPFEPAQRHTGLYQDIEYPEPPNLYETKTLDPNWSFPNKVSGSRFADKENTNDRERTHDAYQNYIRTYLQCIQGVDEGVGRLLDYLEEKGKLDNTIVVYTSDQSFFMGEHGMMDKRFMYEEAHRMPMVVRYPKAISAGNVNNDFVTNVDFAPTLLDFAGIETPSYMDGKSFKGNITNGQAPLQRNAVYYRYWMNFKGYNIPAHYGIRTREYKLIYFYGQSCGTSGSIDKDNFIPQWELYDLTNDPTEMNNVYNDKAYQGIVENLKSRLAKLQDECGDTPIE